MNIPFAAVALSHVIAYNLPMPARATLADVRHKLIEDEHQTLLMVTSNPKIADLFIVQDPNIAINEIFYKYPAIAAKYEGLHNFAPYPQPAVQ